MNDRMNERKTETDRKNNRQKLQKEQGINEEKDKKRQKEQQMNTKNKRQNDTQRQIIQKDRKNNLISLTHTKVQLLVKFQFSKFLFLSYQFKFPSTSFVMWPIHFKFTLMN